MPPPPRKAASTALVVGLVYCSLLLDNVLLTAVVPILPDVLYRNEVCYDSNVSMAANCSSGRMGHVLRTEGEEAPWVGLLLSSKALVQLAANPLLALATRVLGYPLPLLFGTAVLLVAALLFATAENFAALMVARSLQGVASSSIGVSGLCVVAALQREDARRSRLLCSVLGSVALGVLLGYPLGGLLYAFVGKPAPFLCVSALVIVDIVLQLLYMDLRVSPEVAVATRGVRQLLGDARITVAAGAILVSTTAMAVLEPCLPAYLIDTFQPEKWQLGTVFVPDSLGYLLATNLCGELALRVGRSRVALAALFLVGVSCVMVASARSLLQLLAPHLGLGLGIGAVDAALVPLLARLAGDRFGSVYALQQSAVSLAYALGPLAGGQLVPAVGFPWVMRVVGALNLLYCPLLPIILTWADDEPAEETPCLQQAAEHVDYKSRGAAAFSYHRFEDSD
ncbi:synaptic vesicular amine transporter-like [Schistocerca americana]|uniref:synaptic vesicular amine transporter-like n=1 Tax=Schistocerca americana TaxID=7009 RepID=UPI001F5031CF|nr:synaptic vesicular amine transporter-like [Schistocerca americana]